MEEIVKQFGPVGGIVSIVAIMLFNTWRDMQKEKNEVKDKTLLEATEAIKKLNKDLNRYYFGLKVLAGDKWPEVKAFIEDDPQKEH